MVFSSMVFLCVFLPAAFCLHLLLPGMRAKNFLLVVASLVFYAYGEPIYVILLVASSAGHYILARLTGECPKIRKLTMTLAVVINLGLLVIFKYSGFLVETFNSVTGAGIPVPQVRMPIGISFFTFQALSDVYKRQCLRLSRNTSVIRSMQQARRPLWFPLCHVQPRRQRQSARTALPMASRIPISLSQPQSFSA